MATETVTVGAALQPLMSDHELHHRLDTIAGSDDDRNDAAVFINPAASAGALLAAAMSRVDRLKESLKAWSCEHDSSTTADKLAEVLAPLAEEADGLLEALRLNLAKGMVHG